MNTMKWLLKREYWENKGGLLWAPVVVGGLMTLFMLVTVIVLASVGKMDGMHINGMEMDQFHQMMTPENQRQVSEGMIGGFMGAAFPIGITMSFVVFFYYLGALFDDRSNRSVLFWKSLPLSDRDTVISKLVTALVIAPLISWAVITLVAAAITLILCCVALAFGVNAFGLVLGNFRTYTVPFEFLAVLPVYMVWALPTAGWLLMVSAWARAKPFLWAVGIPLVAGGLISWINGMADLNWRLDILWRDVIGRLLLSAVPGSWSFLLQDPSKASIQSLDHASPIGSSWQLFATPEMWVGAVVGIAMIVVAIRLRRFRDEG